MRVDGGGELLLPAFGLHRLAAGRDRERQNPDRSRRPKERGPRRHPERPPGLQREPGAGEVGDTHPRRSRPRPSTSGSTRSSNYITALDFAEEGERYRKYWTGAGERFHLIGKDIIRFHCLYWPALLHAAGVPVPTRVFAQGRITKDGRKLSKTTGNVIDPVELVADHGPDAVRYFLLREAFVRAGLGLHGQRLPGPLQRRSRQRPRQPGVPGARRWSADTARGRCRPDRRPRVRRPTAQPGQGQGFRRAIRIRVRRADRRPS